MGSVGWNIDARPGADGLRLATEGEFELSLEKREHLFEIVTMRRRTAAVRHEHVDEAIAPGRLRPRDKDGVCAARDRDMLQSGAVWIGDRQLTVGVVGRNCSG